MQCPASRSHLGHHLGPLKVVVAQRLSVEVPQQQDAEIRAVVDDRRADAGPLGGPGVVVLRVAVDTQKIAAGVGAAGDIYAVGGGDLDVAIGQPAGEFLQLPRPSGHGRNLVQQRVELGVGQRKRHRFTVTVTSLKV